MVFPKQIVGSSRASTRYEYNEFTDKKSGDKPIHYCDLSEITNPAKSTYLFQYQPAKPGTKHGRGRHLSSVTLPGDFGVVTFTPLTVLSPKTGKPRRRTFVTDAEGNGIFYEFEGNRIEEISDSTTVLARVAVYAAQSVTYFTGNDYQLKKDRIAATGKTKLLGTERYRFDLGAGGIVSEAIDMNENVTRFTYKDKIPSGKIGVTHPLAIRHRDPSSWTTPLGAKTQFTYSKMFRLLVKTVDPLGRISVNEISTPSEVVVSKRIYANAKDFENDSPFSRTDSKYESENFPGFETLRTIRKTAFSPEKLSWEVDLVEKYVPDKHGRREKVIYDPDGLNFATKTLFDANGNVRSRIYASGYRIDFKYDGVNRISPDLQTVERSGLPLRLSMFLKGTVNTNCSLNPMEKLPKTNTTRWVTRLSRSSINQAIIRMVPERKASHPTMRWDRSPREPMMTGIATSSSTTAFNGSLK